ncbi:hypothetical protein [Chryseobacterium tongliaoense]|uniref:hypothetical protein n=1 Tax=Chryseobacterium tongliaoense TaxID=3240933 RepID=UPI003519ADC2
MNKIIIACLIIFSSFAYAQESSENDNPFMREESSRASSVEEEETMVEEDIFPGNPGDPQAAPVDQYIPVLILVALGIIVAHVKRNKIAE